MREWASSYHFRFLCRTLDAELEAVLLSKATHFGLPADWVSRLDKLDPERRQVRRNASLALDAHKMHTIVL